MVEKLAEIAKNKNVTPGQLTLAWLLAQGDDIIPIPGTKKINYLEENWGALAVKLTDEEKAEIRRLVAEAEVHGGRYPASDSSDLFGDTPELEGAINDMMS